MRQQVNIYMKISESSVRKQYLCSTKVYLPVHLIWGNQNYLLYVLSVKKRLLEIFRYISLKCNFMRKGWLKFPYAASCKIFGREIYKSQPVWLQHLASEALYTSHFRRTIPFNHWPSVSGFTSAAIVNLLNTIISSNELFKNKWNYCVVNEYILFTLYV
jgi:hypothetical protein